MNTCCGSVAKMQKLISISLNLFRDWYCSLNYMSDFCFNFICKFKILDCVRLPVVVGGVGQNRFGS